MKPVSPIPVVKILTNSPPGKNNVIGNEPQKNNFRPNSHPYIFSSSVTIYPSLKIFFSILASMIQNNI